MRYHALSWLAKTSCHRHCVSLRRQFPATPNTLVAEITIFPVSQSLILYSSPGYSGDRLVLSRRGRLSALGTSKESKNEEMWTYQFVS